MNGTSETSNANNIANFQQLIEYCTSYGAMYDPSKPALQLLQLEALHTDAVNAMNDLKNVYPILVIKVNAREQAFANLSKLTTRVMSALEASDVQPEIVADARTLARKIQGKRANSKVPPIPDDPNTPEDESQKSISASQLSYDNLVEHFDKLIKLLESEGKYNPNEADLKVVTLNVLLSTMLMANAELMKAVTLVNNARIRRNEVLYTDVTGLVAIAGGVKTYIKSVFGATSGQYIAVRKLKFTKRKK